jgi:hypothetical protein
VWGVWGVWGVCGVWGVWGTFDIPQTALVATLDTYDLLYLPMSDKIIFNVWITTIPVLLETQGLGSLFGFRSAKIVSKYLNVAERREVIFFPIGGLKMT